MVHAERFAVLLAVIIAPCVLCQNASATVQVSIYEHKTVPFDCTVSAGTVSISFEAVCDKCTSSPPIASDDLGGYFFISCVDGLALSMQSGCDSDCKNCTSMIDGLNSCSTSNKTSHGIEIDNIALNDTVCRSQVPHKTSIFIADHERATKCEADQGSVTTVRMYEVPTMACTKSQYGDYFYLNWIQSANGTSLNGEVNCTINCTSCGLKIHTQNSYECIQQGNSSFSLFHCIGEANHIDKGPRFTGELLAVGVVVLIVGILLLLKSCEQRGKDAANLSINATEEDSPLLFDKMDTKRENRPKMKFDKNGDSAVESSEEFARPIVSPDDIAAAVAAERAEQLERVVSPTGRTHEGRRISTIRV